eukprot:12907296-Prorocentrum_lima.AAC.1
MVAGLGGEGCCMHPTAHSRSEIAKCVQSCARPSTLGWRRPLVLSFLPPTPSHLVSRPISSPEVSE